MKATHGTQLRHLIELLDGAVGAAYEEAGINYRPRYTSVVRALMASEPASIGAIAETAGITQPAATQTIALMVKDGLVSAEAGPTDGRQKLIRFTDKGRDLIPRLQDCWHATRLASDSLEADLPFPLGKVLDRTIKALEAKSFGERIRQARAVVGITPSPPIKKRE